MNPDTNPFSPGAGAPPPALAGRGELLQHAMTALARIKNGLAERSLFLVGLRGVGKTVLLTRIAAIAEDKGYKSVMVEANEGKSLALILLPALRTLFYDLNRGAQVSAKARRGLAVLKSFIASIKLKFHDVEFSLDIDPEIGSADSGDLESDLAQVFVALGEAAQDRGTAVAVIMDELQYLEDAELSALIMAAHKLAQKALPVILIGAGLPQLIGKAGNAKSYAERLFQYPEIGPLAPVDATEAVLAPLRNQNVQMTPDALDEILRITQGYPYFLQEWGYFAWNLAQHSPITLADVHAATDAAVQRLDKNFFRSRFDRLTPQEKLYLRAMAELGDSPQRSGDIADKLGRGVNQVSPLRSNLIHKGMIYSPTHGDTAYTVPMFGAFMKRIMPDFLPLPKRVRAQ